MSEELIMTNDSVVFDTASFMQGDPTLKFITPVLPIPIMGSGSHTISPLGAKGCLEGDEQKVQLPGVMFNKPPAYPLPGSGTFFIDKLNKDQLSQKTTCDGKKLILKGTQFDAVFTVMSPPCQSPPPTSGGLPDTAKFEYKGKGSFLPKQKDVTDAS